MPNPFLHGWGWVWLEFAHILYILSPLLEFLCITALRHLEKFLCRHPLLLAFAFFPSPLLP